MGQLKKMHNASAYVVKKVIQNSDLKLTEK